MAHGTPGSASEIEAFYTSIRRGQPPTPELLAELESRYEAIGGLSPLTAITRMQVEALRAELERRAPGRYAVGYGAKHVEPTIEQGMAGLIAAGVDRVVGVVLTPHESPLGSRSYLERAAAAAGPTEFVGLPSWHRTEGFVDLLAERTRQAMASLDPPSSERVQVFFTAHSLPETSGEDTYPRQVAETAGDVARALGLSSTPGVGWGVAWQSAGKAPGRWLGPELLGELDRVADGGATAVVVCPVGFVADHLEILYDLDVQAAGAARARDMAFVRTASLNHDPRFAAVLARAVEGAVAEAAGSEASTTRRTVVPGGVGGGGGGAADRG
jgi:ferrochelatase